MASSSFASLEGATIAQYSQEPNYDYLSQTPNRVSVECDRGKLGLPTRFPKSIISPTAWTAADFENDSNRERYTLALDADQIEEIEQACRHFNASGIPLQNLSQESFPLPALGDKLKALATELTSGVGFFHIRGLDPQRYSNRMNVVLYLGISSYIGKKRGRQDELGNMLLHLTDLGSAAAPESERQAPYSNVGQPFHTDIGDIIGLYSLGEAECGGESQLAPSSTVYNEIAKTRPDIIRLLSSPSWVFDRFGQSPSHTVRSILYSMLDGKVMFSFSMRPLVGNRSSPRSCGIPDLSKSQIEAINMVQSVAERHALSMKLKPGDLLFWNNMALLHSRAGFTDSSDRKRHLLRLWLRNDATEKHWPVPEVLQASWNDAFVHAERPQLWPIEPIRDRDYIINQQRSSGHD